MNCKNRKCFNEHCDGVFLPKTKIDVLCPCMCDDHFMWECSKCGEISLDCFDLFKLKLSPCSQNFDYYAMYKINVCNMFFSYLFKNKFEKNLCYKTYELLECSETNLTNKLINYVNNNFSETKLLETSKKFFDKQIIINFIKENFDNTSLTELSNDLIKYINEVLQKDEILEFIEQNYDQKELIYFVNQIIYKNKLMKLIQII